MSSILLGSSQSLVIG